MNTILVTKEDNYAIVQLNRGRANAINVEMLNELGEIFQELETDEAIKGVIITGQPRFFSAGLDVIELYEFDRKQLAGFWMLFGKTIGRLVAFSKPMVAAISGHSPAGGTVIANTADIRIMAKGKYTIGLNEIPVGIIVPEFIYKNYAFWLGNRKAYQFILEGKLLTVDEAYEHQLVDKIVEESELMEAAKIQLKKYISFNTNALRKSKLNMRKELIQYFSNVTAETFEPGLDQWFSPECRAIMGAMVEKLKR